MGRDIKTEAKQRLSAVRLRTWVISATILISLGFWLILQVTTRDSLSWIDFIMLCVIQILGHLAYFPDGEIYGQTDQKFQDNKKAYNDLANKINDDKKFEKLREYCVVEYEERKENYINTVLGYIGITEKEFEDIKQKEAKEIKKIKEFEIIEQLNGEEKRRVIHFNKLKRQLLYDLIFKPLPVQRNEAQTIVSAKETDTSKKLQDKTRKEKTRIYAITFLKIVLTCLLLAYISWNIRDNFGWGDVARLITYIGSLLITAIMSFTSGERIQKVYKSAFYLDLYQFIKRFEEWEAKHHE